MQCVPVGFRIHRHGLDVQFFAGADHSQGDFPAVGYENLLEHNLEGRYRLRLGRMPNRGCPYSTGCPFSTNIRSTSPLISDSISFISFIASTMHSVCQTSTCRPTFTNGSAPGLGEPQKVPTLADFPRGQ